MTKEEILAMEAGAKLDAFVHVKVMDRHHPEPLEAQHPTPIPLT